MTDAPATNELLACPTCGKLPGSKVGPPRLVRCIEQSCPGSSLRAETPIEWNTRAAATPSAEVSVEELAACLRKFVGWDGEMEAARALLGKYRMEKR